MTEWGPDENNWLHRNDDSPPPWFGWALLFLAGWVLVITIKLFWMMKDHAAGLP